MANTHNLELFFLPASSMNSDHEVIPSACPSCVSALTSDPPRKLASSAPLASLEGDALISGFYSQPSVRVGPGLGGSHCLPPASGNLHILTVESSPHPLGIQLCWLCEGPFSTLSVCPYWFLCPRSREQCPRTQKEGGGWDLPFPPTPPGGDRAICLPPALSGCT